MSIIQKMMESGRGGFRHLKNGINEIKGGIDAAKELAKGIYYCTDCLKDTITSKSPDPGAFQKAISSGKFKKDNKHKCTLCGEPSSYSVSLKTATKAIAETKK